MDCVRSRARAPKGAPGYVGAGHILTAESQTLAVRGRGVSVGAYSPPSARVPTTGAQWSPSRALHSQCARPPSHRCTRARWYALTCVQHVCVPAGVGSVPKCPFFVAFLLVRHQHCLGVERTLSSDSCMLLVSLAGCPPCALLSSGKSDRANSVFSYRDRTDIRTNRIDIHTYRYRYSHTYLSFALHHHDIIHGRILRFRCVGSETHNPPYR